MDASVREDRKVAQREIEGSRGGSDPRHRCEVALAAPQRCQDRDVRVPEPGVRAEIAGVVVAGARHDPVLKLGDAHLEDGVPIGHLHPVILSEVDATTGEIVTR